MPAYFPRQVVSQVHRDASAGADQAKLHAAPLPEGVSQAADQRARPSSVHHQQGVINPAVGPFQSAKLRPDVDHVAVVGELVSFGEAQAQFAVAAAATAAAIVEAGSRALISARFL